jgi:hypothetical protein
VFDVSRGSNTTEYESIPDRDFVVNSSMIPDGDTCVGEDSELCSSWSIGPLFL